MKIVGSMVALALFAGLGACSNNSQNPPAQSAQTYNSSSEGAGCGIAQLRDVHATVADTDDGVAITFTAPQNQLDQLHKAVHAMADANDRQGNAFASCPCAFGQPGSAEATPGQQAYGATSMQQSNNGASYASNVAADSHVDEIPTGAVLKLDAKDKAQLQALRGDARAKVHSMQDNGCLAKR